MGKNSKIEWTDHTWNPWQGCHKISEGCVNCYMFREKKRYGQEPNIVIRSKLKTFNAPMYWREEDFVFVCSWSDFFIEEADAWRNEAWNIIRRTPWLTYQIPTKRPERIAECLPSDWENGWRWPNVWLGISAENQRRLKERWEQLAQVPTALYWLSIEPMLEKMDISGLRPKLGWVVTGGESGAKDKIRIAKLDWFRSVRDQCVNLGIPYFHKQHGGHRKINGVWGGFEIDGQIWNQMPRFLKSFGVETEGI